MDNDNKIKNASDEGQRDLVEHSKLVFLREVVDEFRRKNTLYDMHHEFAKTKKNRSPIVPLIVLGVGLLFLIGAVAVTLYIQEEGKKIAVDISDFEDVNLKEVLDTARKNEQDMMEAQREMDGLTWAMDEEIEMLVGENRRRMDLLEAGSLSPADKEGQRGAIRRAEAAGVARIQAAYQPQIEEVQQKIDEIQKRVDAYDSRMLAQAREQQEILDNQQRLAQIELQNVKNYYEERIASIEDKNSKEIAALRAHEREIVRVLEARQAREIESLTLLYNPQLGDPEVLELLEQDLGSPEGIAPGAYRRLLAQEGVMTPGDYAVLGRISAGYDRLAAELDKIPYKNSVPPILRQLTAGHKGLVLRYEKLWNNLADGIEAKNKIIEDRDRRLESYALALDHFVKISRENGFIIDPRDPERILVYMDDIRTIPEGTLGLVFRRDDEYIGQIRFLNRNGELLASLEELEDREKPIRPFDIILIQEH